MSWLGRDQKAEKGPDKPAEPMGGKTTIIGEGLEIQGDLIAREDVWIAGQIKGKIISDRRVVVAATGKVTANVQCRNLLIYGEVKGDVVADQEVIIESSGRLIGDLTTPKFIARPGGFFEGYSRMSEALKGESANVAEFQKKKTSRG